MYPSLKSANAFTNGSPANACVHFDAHIFAEGSDYVFDLFGKFTIGSKDEGLALSEIGVDRGKGANGKSAGLSLLFEGESMTKLVERFLFWDENKQTLTSSRKGALQIANSHRAHKSTHCTRLSLCNQIATHHDRLNRPLLNCTGFFKPI
mmetsp:Transcript_7557/g.16337  ORF Transcript_7557/g.16337 Transcript_7557/m.16337 type:complete len:150 (+) Transcript_7557:1270-1719(+)